MTEQEQGAVRVFPTLKDAVNPTNSRGLDHIPDAKEMVATKGSGEKAQPFHPYFIKLLDFREGEIPTAFLINHQNTHLLGAGEAKQEDKA